MIYQEVQRFQQKRLWTILGAIEAIYLTFVIYQLTFASSEAQVPSRILIPLLVPPTLIFLGFWRARLIWGFDKDGIAIRWDPFQKQDRKISWDSVEEMELFPYKAWGLGIRAHRTYGNIFKASGSLGWQLTLFSGQKILLGVSDEAAFTEAINQIPVFRNLQNAD